MKKKIIFFLIFLVCAVVISDFLGNFALTNTFGGFPNSSGSPGDGQTCQRAGCHTSSASVGSGGSITSNIPVSGYIPGNTYTITASITGNSSKFGFQVSPQNASGTALGTMTATTNQTQIFGAGYMTHTQLGTSGSGSKTWNFNWTAPASGTGNVTFYGAFMITNNDNTSSGDTTKTNSLPVSENLSTKEITSFRFNGLNPPVVGTIDQNAQTIELTVPYGTNVTNLVPTIAHIGASVNPPSGTASNFSSPQNYTVTAQNGSTKTYTVTVTVELNNSKDITSFKFSGINPEVTGTINENTQTIDLVVPDGTDLTNLVPTIVHTGDGINPPSGVANDFSSPQDYTVTAENGTIKTYTVNVTEAGDSKNITSFKFSDLNPEVIGVIDQVAQTIELIIPYGTNATNLVPTIVHTGDSINPPSGVANDFSSPQTYTVTALNSSIKVYTVTVNIASSINEMELNNAFEIYPNPVSDKVFVKQATHSKIAHITIINKNGKVVKSFNISEKIHSFDVEDLVPGIYFIKAETEKGSSVKKIVKH